ncbi:MAG: Do family serine endopeptidase [Bacteroidales bacterium]|nr:Do family serine endopeptidase [Bacteroidales bacterium]MCF8333389.1 Do family serine endopeptidase [Bacteroidales bacterium]
MKINRTNIIYLLVGAFIAIGIYAFTIDEGTSQKENERKTVQQSANSTQRAEIQKTSYSFAGPQGTSNFTEAAKKTVHAVVHIKTKYQRKPSIYDFFYDFRDGDRGRGRGRPAIASGSGVIISEDGYIVTNNHVVTKADRIEVTLNDKRTYEAEIVGTDPSTDLALIKIDETGLPYLKYGDSEEVQVGEWVLAVGNPFNLTSTVTAGIVSAKARDINILGPAAGQRKTAIESFIQTDAAVNKGNSGGALVNTEGELIGINAAIASNTGSYAGYSFAIPVNIAKKVVNDLLQYGRVQRGYIGVTIRDLNAKLAEKEGIDEIEGVYVEGVQEESSAAKAGLKHGDIILAVDGHKVNSTSELIGYVGQFRPGDNVEVKIKRDGETKTYNITLTNRRGGTELIEERPEESLEVLGAKFEKPDKKTMQKLGIDNGVQITQIQQNSLLRKKGIEEGFIILRIDKEPITSVEEVKQNLKQKRGGILIEGVYPNGTRAYYGFGL